MNLSKKQGQQGYRRQIFNFGGTVPHAWLTAGRYSVKQGVNFMKPDRHCFYERKRNIFTAFLILIFLPSYIFSNEVILQDHSKIQILSDFRLIGTVELRTEKEKSAPVACRTLNHEGGINARVLEILGEDVYKNEHGKWLYILLTKPIWAESGEWLEQHSKFLIFLPDETPVYDFEE